MWISHIVLCERVAADKLSNFILVFAKGCGGQVEIAILLQFLTIKSRFVRKGCAGRLELALLPQFLRIEAHFVRKGCAGRLELALSPQFSDEIFVSNSHLHISLADRGPVEIAILPQFLGIEPHFVRNVVVFLCLVALSSTW